MKKGNWKAKLEEVEAAPAAAAKKRKPREAEGIRKRDVFDKAAQIFHESGGTISTVQLGKKVKVSAQTIANWKKMPEWNQAAPVPAKAKLAEAVPVAQEMPKLKMPEVNVAAVIAAQDLIALNERLRSMLDREYLTAADLEHLSNAKLSLLEAADVYLAIIQDSGREE